MIESKPGVPNAGVELGVRRVGSKTGAVKRTLLDSVDADEQGAKTWDVHSQRASHKR